MSDDWIGLFDTSIQYYLGVDASQLDDDEWALTIARLAKIRKLEAENKRPIFF